MRNSSSKDQASFVESFRDFFLTLMIGLWEHKFSFLNTALMFCFRKYWSWKLTDCKVVLKTAINYWNLLKSWENLGEHASSNNKKRRSSLGVSIKNMKSKGVIFHNLEPRGNCKSTPLFIQMANISLF